MLPKHPVLKQNWPIPLAQLAQDSAHPTFAMFCSDKVLVEMDFVLLLPGIGTWTRTTSGWFLLYIRFISIHSLFEPSLSFLRYLTFYF